MLQMVIDDKIFIANEEKLYSYKDCAREFVQAGQHHSFELASTCSNTVSMVFFGVKVTIICHYV
jgi:hypothetical protein